MSRATVRTRGPAARALPLVTGLAALILVSVPAAEPAQSPGGAVFREGVEAYQRGDLAAAAAAFAEAARLDPANPRAHYHLCVARVGLGQAARAAEDCGRAIRLDPGYAEAYYVRGLARSQHLGDNAGGIQDFDHAIRIKPTHAPAHLKRGNARVRLGDLRGGLADYDRAIALDSGWADAYFNRGVVRHNLDDVRGALDDLRQAARLSQEQGDRQGVERARSAIEHVRSGPR